MLTWVLRALLPALIDDSWVDFRLLFWRHDGDGEAGMSFSVSIEPFNSEKIESGSPGETGSTWSARRESLETITKPGWVRTGVLGRRDRVEGEGNGAVDGGARLIREFDRMGRSETFEVLWPVSDEVFCCMRRWLLVLIQEQWKTFKRHNQPIKKWSNDSQQESFGLLYLLKISHPRVWS
jgi:hypothetical protein